MSMTIAEYKERRERVLNRKTERRYTDGEYNAYQDWKNGRKVEKLQDFPFHVREKIRAVIEVLRLKFPQTETMRLVGSYAKGEYIDEYSTQAEIEMKEKVRGYCKFSDIDIEITPKVYDMFHLNDMKIHLMGTSTSSGFNIFEKDTYEMYEL